MNIYHIIPFNHTSAIWHYSSIESVINIFMTLLPWVFILHVFKALSHFRKIYFICFNESPLKMRKNVFYFILKALFVLKRFKFLFWLFGRVKKTGLIRKITLISRFMASQPGSLTITIHVLANISRSKCDQTMKFG